MPHGAMPIVQIFPLDLEAWSFSASPTCRMTPVCVHVFERRAENQTTNQFYHDHYKGSVYIMIHSGVKDKQDLLDNMAVS